MGIKVLDCTLRDGAYVTGGTFGRKCIEGVVTKLRQAGVDIIECGWLKDLSHHNDSVYYNKIEEVNEFLSNTAIMFDYGKYDLENLTFAKNGGIIRIAFYKNDLDKISFEAEHVKNKGYSVFLQASNTIDYSEQELIKLCKRANYIGADSLYIVDSFGSMFPDDLDRIMNVYNDTVDKKIPIGFHSHNGMQLSVGLSIQFIKRMTRDIIVDTSLCGIGRGAGNTPTEILLEYLNRNGSSYNIDMVWECIKKYIEPLFANYSWAYTPHKGYRGIHKLHPNSDLEKI